MIGAPRPTWEARGASLRRFGRPVGGFLSGADRLPLPAAHWVGPVGVFTANADRLPLPALTARDVPPALVAIPTRTFDLAHEFGNQAAIRCVAKASAECVDLSMSQIQGAALLHRITTTHAVEIEQRCYDQ